MLILKINLKNKKIYIILKYFKHKKYFKISLCCFYKIYFLKKVFFYYFNKLI